MAEKEVVWVKNVCRYYENGMCGKPRILLGQKPPKRLPKLATEPFSTWGPFLYPMCSATLPDFSVNGALVSAQRACRGNYRKGAPRPRGIPIAYAASKQP